MAVNPASSALGTNSARIQIPQDFSLILGGPLFQILRRAHLSDDALLMVRRRIVVISTLAWLPLLVLSAIEVRLLDGSVGVPFLFDVEVHVRYLAVLPLLIVAELVVHHRLRPLLQQFLERNLIPEGALPRFEAAVESAFRLRNSVLAEVLLIAFVYGFGILVVWRQSAIVSTTTCYPTPSPDGYLGHFIAGRLCPLSGGGCLLHTPRSPDSPRHAATRRVLSGRRGSRSAEMTWTSVDPNRHLLRC